MKIKNLALMLCLLPIAAWAATGGNNARVGMTRSNSASGVRMSAVSNIVTKKVAAAPVVEQRSGASVASTQEEATDEEFEEEEVVEETKKEITPENCREFYQACMDDFCLLDETEGSRCACSDNIEKSKSLIQQIQKIQSEADDLYTTGVEREKLGAKARLVFGESEAAKKSKSGIDFSAWLNGGDDADADVGEDMDIGQNLYAMALDACKEELKACGAKAKAEETLYSRKITADCKSFSTYLNDQKREAEMNKKTAEAAVRSVLVSPTKVVVG